MKTREEIRKKLIEKILAERAKGDLDNNVPFWKAQVEHLKWELDVIAFDKKVLENKKDEALVRKLNIGGK